MKTIQINTYKFSELSEEAKQNAIEEYRSNNTEYFWACENRQSLEKFADIFPITVKDWSYGGRGEGVYFKFNTDDNIEELSGQRLALYLWNNYKNDIYSKKYHYVKSHNKINHKRVKSELIKKGSNAGLYHNSYYSAIFIETYNCPLTGYCIDNSLLDEIWKFIDKPDSRNFRDLLEDCFNEWVKDCNADVDYQNSDECITETIEANDYDFDEEGNLI
jgi:hypothetical protein